MDCGVVEGLDGGHFRIRCSEKTSEIHSEHRRDLSGMIYSWIDRSAGRVPDKMNIGRSSERLYIR